MRLVRACVSRWDCFSCAFVRVRVFIVVLHMVVRFRVWVFFSRVRFAGRLGGLFVSVGFCFICFPVGFVQLGL